MADLLLHSMSEFKEILNHAMYLKKPKNIVEIGSEYGGSTKVLLEYAKGNNAYVYIIDPSPYVDLDVVLKDFEGYYTHIKELSLIALLKIKNIDMCFIDGDHNYYTVFNELKCLITSNPKVWIFLHDVKWPCGYRDLYYNPNVIPNKSLHNYSYSNCINENNEVDAKGGFNGNGNFAFANQYGGKKNGVKSAVDDFILENNAYYYNEIDPVMGLGLIVPVSDMDSSVLILRPYQNYLINTLEKNRIELYVKYLQLIAQTEKARRKREENILFRISRKISNKINYRKFY